MVHTRLFVLLLAAALLCVPGSVQALSVGVAPPVLDAGEMLPGESKLMEFYIITDHDKDLLVELSVRKPRRDFYMPGKGRFRYEFAEDNSSEEDISGWVTFLNKRVIVPPDKNLVYLSGGGCANANKKVELIITVPDDAEPGYHAGYVSPYPRLNFGGGGTGLGIISVVEMGYIVNVLGEATRDAGIAGFDFSMDRPGHGTLCILVKNMGTVTITARADHVRVFDSDNQTVTATASNERFIAPGEIGRLDMGIDTRGLEGVHGVTAHMEWLTGEDSLDGEIDISEYAPPAPGVTGGVVAPPAAPMGFPLWILPIILMLAGIMVWWRVK